ncbi:MAG: AAA family ATPase [Candidatus Schekmanbacteria bacterium]|nr:AAA family ATPase [Candidatus Schekmanbacteria bacterium]
MTIPAKYRLSKDKLYWKCNLKGGNFEGLEKLEPAEGTIGQDRALKALKIGLELYSSGYNIFVTGLTGTGRRTTVRKILEKMRPKCGPLFDRLYVNNFKDNDHPRLITLPAGEGAKFAKSMKDIISFLRKNLSQIFEGESIVKRKQQVAKQFEEENKKIFNQFDSDIKSEGFVIGQVQLGQMTVPDLLFMIDGKPYPISHVEAMADEGKIESAKFEKMEGRYIELKEGLRKIFNKITKLNMELGERLKEIERESCVHVIDGMLEEVRETRHEYCVNEYLHELKESILNDIELFKSAQETRQQQEAAMPISMSEEVPINPFLKYDINLLLTNSKDAGCPIIIEPSPTVATLFGTIERDVSRSGMWFSSFMNIKAGSLLRADGGYLVLNANDVFMNPMVWPILKRVLKTGKLDIQSTPSIFQMESLAIKPQPIEVNIKVIMIGDSEIYELLYSYEEDFRKVFKIKAEFDTQMDLNNKNITLFLSVVAKMCSNKNLAGLKTDALERIIEYGVRRAGARGKLITRFSEIEDLLLQADYWRKQKGDKIITAVHIDEAIDNTIERHNLMQTKIQEMIDKGIIIIDCEGEKVGQVNGLAVYSMGAYSFGKPSRISAAVSVGQGGIVNIEREVKLSGSTHDKGVLILTGYLREKYSQDMPLNLYASICFEQSYSGIDGDSASSTELYALLSSLSDVPIKQSIAVTGSVDQKGDVQPIGGVNEKIEGFFDVCVSFGGKEGLNGKQGVMIPRRNVNDLMLRHDVVKAVEEGKFNIYAVDNIEQGIEILTGVKAGRKKKDGTFEKDTINYFIYEKLKKFAKSVKPRDAEKNDKDDEPVRGGTQNKKRKG